MKNLFKYFVLIALLFSANVVLVNAENGGTHSDQNGDSNVNVTVGNVEVPVYNVEISWDDFIFDWKYDYETRTYNWGRTDCAYIDPVVDWRPDVFYERDFYLNSSCTGNTISGEEVKATENKGMEFYYLTEGEAPEIDIIDASEGGYITASLSWTPEEKYDFTTATFSYVKEQSTCVEIPATDVHEEAGAFTSSNCEGEKTFVANEPVGTKFYDWETNEVETEFDGELPLEADRGHQSTSFVEEVHEYWYTVKANLSVDSTKTVTTPTAGEQIGTVTVSIETH